MPAQQADELMNTALAGRRKVWGALRDAEACSCPPPSSMEPRGSVLEEMFFILFCLFSEKFHSHVIGRPDIFLGRRKDRAWVFSNCLSREHFGS